MVHFHLRFKHVQVNLLLIYRIPNTSVLSFGNDLTDIIENNIMLNRGTPLLIGDFNIHTDNIVHPDTVLFNNILDGLNLRNNVNFATHKSLHHLDLILDDKEDRPHHKCSQRINAIRSLFYSCQNQDNSNPPKTEEITYRKLKNIDSRQLSRDITETLPQSKTGSVSHLVDYYNTSMRSLLDKHAPEKTKVIKQSHNQPWFNNTIKSEIVLRRKKEHTFFIDPTHYNFQAFYNQRRYVANLIKTAQKDLLHHPT